ncbi:hypothetical protein [Demequina zhanjiangensis]|uniref:Uncharacterized protein n=1 Tax=Demequina zhanjiangensis TaxID=3051659 RepID=A0ABT8G1D0_9MICO|nr:hypothetical protein [Demequina sp. SYSU T00b26]MDN4472837.1 hypothetical protein [Demequina sp. SYSU T00b26]
MRVGVALAVIAGVAACDGGPGFYVKVNLVSECDATIWARVTKEIITEGKDVFDGDDFVIEPGESLAFETSILQPVGDNLRLWTAASPEDGFYSSTLVPTSDLEHYVDAEEYDVYVVPITGDLCPG